VSNPGFYLEILVAALLIATIAYCVVLNRRLAGLRRAQADMADLVREFDTATEAAKAGIAELKTASGDIGTGLDQTMARARALLDELDLMVESGERVAQRLDGAIENGRAGGHAAAVDPIAETAPARTDAERELLQALRKTR